MKSSRLALVAISSGVAFAALGCGSQGNFGSGSAEGGGIRKLNEQQAAERSEEIIHQAVDSMSPKPHLKRIGTLHLRACVADGPGSGNDRVQVWITYQLTNVPGRQAKSLVRQARDAWIGRGYKFQSSDADWSNPFPTVNMRTPSDDFWMSAITGIVNQDKGEGLAAIFVSSPCFSKEDTPEAEK
ncbi:hypothetical protein ACVNF4_01550 [Streptomyces sp. S6]